MGDIISRKVSSQHYSNNGLERVTNTKELFNPHLISVKICNILSKLQNKQQFLQ